MLTAALFCRNVVTNVVLEGSWELKESVSHVREERIERWVYMPPVRRVRLVAPHTDLGPQLWRNARYLCVSPEPFWMEHKTAAFLARKEHTNLIHSRQRALPVRQTPAPREQLRYVTLVYWWNIVKMWIKAGVSNWKKVAQNRDSWKKVVEQARTLYRL